LSEERHNPILHQIGMAYTRNRLTTGEGGVPPLRGVIPGGREAPRWALGQISLQLSLSIRRRELGVDQNSWSQRLRRLVRLGPADASLAVGPVPLRQPQKDPPVEQTKMKRNLMLKRMLRSITHLIGILGSVLLVVGVADWVARWQ
jgi:hypothetical protein